MNRGLEALLDEQLFACDAPAKAWLLKSVYPDFFDTDVPDDEPHAMRISHDDFVAGRFRFLIDEEIKNLREAFPEIEVLDEDREVVLLRGPDLPTRLAVERVLGEIWSLLGAALQPPGVGPGLR